VSKVTGAEKKRAVVSSLKIDLKSTIIMKCCIFLCVICKSGNDGEHQILGKRDTGEKFKTLCETGHSKASGGYVEKSNCFNGACSVISAPALRLVFALARSQQGFAECYDSLCVVFFVRFSQFAMTVEKCAPNALIAV
jgi:hypothetical protein